MLKSSFRINDNFVDNESHNYCYRALIDHLFGKDFAQNEKFLELPAGKTTNIATIERKFKWIKSGQEHDYSINVLINNNTNATINVNFGTFSINDSGWSILQPIGNDSFMHQMIQVKYPMETIAFPVRSTTTSEPVMTVGFWLKGDLVAKDGTRINEEDITEERELEGDD